MTDDTNALLAERGKTHGDYFTHATITQSLKQLMGASDNWARLSMPQREALDMVAHKIGRILAGDPNHIDHWDDIAGYSKLVANGLRDESWLDPTTDKFRSLYAAPEKGVAGCASTQTLKPI
jgi:hypothetical protein